MDDWKAAGAAMDEEPEIGEQVELVTREVHLAVWQGKEHGVPGRWRASARIRPHWRAAGAGPARLSCYIAAFSEADHDGFGFNL